MSQDYRPEEKGVWLVLRDIALIVARIFRIPVGGGAGNIDDPGGAVPLARAFRLTLGLLAWGYVATLARIAEGGAYGVAALDRCRPCGWLCGKA